jgi:hypothetical protein
VCSDLCCAHFFGAVRISHGARQKKTSGKKEFVVRFYVGARKTNSLSCVFSLAHDKHFFPRYRR